MVGQALSTCRASRPGMRVHEVALVDQTVSEVRVILEKEMVVSGGHEIGYPIGGGRSGKSPGLGSPPGNRVASAELSQVLDAFAYMTSSVVGRPRSFPVGCVMVRATPWSIWLESLTDSNADAGLCGESPGCLLSR